MKIPLFILIPFIVACGPVPVGQDPANTNMTGTSPGDGATNPQNTSTTTAAANATKDANYRRYRAWTGLSSIYSMTCNSSKSSAELLRSFFSIRQVGAASLETTSKMQENVSAVADWEWMVRPDGEWLATQPIEMTLNRYTLSFTGAGRVDNKTFSQPWKNPNAVNQGEAGLVDSKIDFVATDIGGELLTGKVHFEFVMACLYNSTNCEQSFGIKQSTYDNKSGYYLKCSFDLPVYGREIVAD